MYNNFMFQQPKSEIYSTTLMYFAYTYVDKHRLILNVLKLKVFLKDIIIFSINHETSRKLARGRNCINAI